MSKLRAVTIGEKGRLTLPEDVRKHLGITAGDVLLMDFTEKSTVAIVAAALIPRDQVWFTHPKAQERIAEAHGDIAAKRTTRVASPSALRAHLGTGKRARRGD